MPDNRPGLGGAKDQAQIVALLGPGRLMNVVPVFPATGCYPAFRRG